MNTATVTSTVFVFNCKELIEFFQWRNKRPHFINHDMYFNQALKECTVDYNEDQEISFDIEELRYSANFYHESKRSTDIDAIEQLKEKVLDMTLKEDRDELIKRFAMLMHHFIEREESTEGSTFYSRNGRGIQYNSSFAWIKLTTGDQLRLMFSWDADPKESGWRLMSKEIADTFSWRNWDLNYGIYFISRNAFAI